MADRQRSDWVAIVLLWLAGLGAAGQYAKISVVFDQLPAMYPDGGAGLGWVLSLVGFVGIALGVVAGVLVARLGFRRVLIWALVAGGVLSLCQGFAMPLWLFLVSRVLEGAAHLGCVVAAPVLIAYLASDRDRPAAMTLWSTFFSVAFMVLAWAGTPLIGWAGPRALFVAHGLWMVSVALVVALRVPALSVPPEGRLDLRAVVRKHGQIYRSPWISAPALGWLAYTMSYVSLVTLLPQPLEPGARAFALGAMPAAALVVSMTVGVWAVRRVGAFRVIQAGFVVGAVLALVLWATPQSVALMVALAAAFGLVQGASFAQVPELNAEPRDQAAASGALAQTGNLGNTLGTPVMQAAGPWMLPLGAVVLAGGAALQAWAAARRKRAAAATEP